MGFLIRVDRRMLFSVTSPSSGGMTGGGSGSVVGSAVGSSVGVVVDSGSLESGVVEGTPLEPCLAGLGAAAMTGFGGFRKCVLLCQSDVVILPNRRYPFRSSSLVPCKEETIVIYFRLGAIQRYTNRW